MIFDRLSAIRGVFGRSDRLAGETAKRWAKAFRAEDELALDIMRIGGVLVQQPVEMVDGYPQSAPIDPLRLAYEAGKRDLAQTLLALGGISYAELNQLMERKDEH